MKKYDLIVIGGGSAGLTAAAGAASFGARVLLIEKQKLGGDCLHYGCVPSKTLIRSAEIAHLISRSGEFGIYTDQLRIELDEVTRRVQSVITDIERHDDPARFEAMGVEVVFGSPSFVSKSEIEVSGQRYFAKKYIIASGGHAKVPKLDGLAEVGYMTNVEVFSIPKTIRSLIILGAGPIACEMAQAFIRLGLAVTVIQRSGRILSREDSDIADVVYARLEKEGVRFELGATSTRVSSENGKKTLHFIQDGQARKVCADEILVALGREPNLEGLNLENAGVEYSTNGIKIDSHQRSSNRNIYVCGDVCATMPAAPWQSFGGGGAGFTHLASYQASLALRNIFFPFSSKADLRAFPRVTFTDPEIASVGLSESEAIKHKLKFEVFKSQFADNDRAKAEAETDGMIKIIAGKKGSILGVTIVGSHAGEMIGEYTLAIRKNLKLADIYATVHPYPTLAEINKAGAGQYMRTLLSPLVKKFLKLWNGFEK